MSSSFSLGSIDILMIQMAKTEKVRKKDLIYDFVLGMALGILIHVLLKGRFALLLF